MPESLDKKLQQFLSNLVSSKHHDLLEMLTEDAVMEFPYAPPTRLPQLVGKQEIMQFFSGFSAFLTLDEIHLVAAHQTIDLNIAVLEFEGRGKYTQSGRPYFQKYISVLTFRDDGSLAGKTTGIRQMAITQPQKRILFRPRERFLLLRLTNIDGRSARPV